MAERLTGVVQGVGQKREIAGPFDGADDLGLLFAGGARAASGLDLTGGVDELNHHVQPLVVDLFFLQLGNSLATSATKLSDGDSLLFNIPGPGIYWDETTDFCW